MALDHALQTIEYDRAQLLSWGDAMVAYIVAKTGFANIPDARLEDFNPFAVAQKRWPRKGAREFIREVKAGRVPRWLLGFAPINELKYAAGND